MWSACNRRSASGLPTWSRRPNPGTDADASHRACGATELPAAAWRTVPWREGPNETLSSRFAAVRVRPASRDWKRLTSHPFEWLLIE